MSVHGYTDDEFEHDPNVTLISKLDVIHPLHLYPNDSSTLIVVSIKRSNTDEVLGLDDSYMQLRSNILAKEPLPDAKGPYALISSKESLRAVVIGSGAGTS
ncbi:hypothetical protein Tco_0670636 [Tanacetum coccineum]